MSLLADLPPQAIYGLCIGTAGMALVISERIKWFIDDRRQT